MSSLTPDSEETQRLLQEARAGQQGAADRLLDRHRPYLYRLIELRMDFFAYGGA